MSFFDYFIYVFIFTIISAVTYYFLEKIWHSFKYKTYDNKKIKPVRKSVQVTLVEHREPEKKEKTFKWEDKEHLFPVIDEEDE